jgi:hypothetical protein
MVGGSLRVLRLLAPPKRVAMILLKVVLNTKNQIKSSCVYDYTCNGVKDLTHMQCDNGRCIPIQWACDGELDCGPGDYSDEINCELKCQVN